MLDAARKRPVLLTGPARSGKTRKMVELFLERSGPLPGEDVLVFLPDRGAVEDFRQRVSAAAGGRGFLSGGIDTLEEWSIRVLGLTPTEITGPERESILLRGLARRLPEPVAGRIFSPHFRSAFLGWASRLRESGIGAGEVRTLVEALPERSGRLDLLADVLEIVQGAGEKERFLFRPEVPIRAARAIDRGTVSFSPPRLLLVDGFHHFSASRIALLTLLLSRTLEAWITLPSADGHESWMEETLDRALSGLAESFDFNRERLDLSEPNLVPVIMGGAGREEEIERIAREILYDCAEEGRKPDDFLLLFRDVGPYQPVIETVFPRFGIPFHGRFQVDGSPTPPGRSLLDLLRLAREGLSRKTAEPLVKNRMFDADPDRADRAAAIWRKWPQLDTAGFLLKCEETDPGFTAERVAPLAAFVEEIRAARGGDIASVLRRWWIEWITPSLREENFPPEDHSITGAAVVRFHTLLENLSTTLALSDELSNLPAEEALLLVEEEIRRARVSYTAGRGDGVRIDDYRHGQNSGAPVVFLPGLEASLTPRAYDPGSFWNEADRERLNRSGQFRVHDRSCHRAEERYLFRRAFTRAEEKVVLTRPAFDRDGKECAPSPYLQEIHEEFPDMEIVDRGSVERFSSSRSVVVVRDILPFLASRTDPAERDSGGIALAASLAEALRLPVPRAPQSFLDPVSLGALPPFMKWISGHDAYSVSELEEYRACPFRYMARYIFRIREIDTPVEFGFSPVTEGEMIHTVLERALRDGGDILSLLEENYREALGDFPERPAHRLSYEILRDGILTLMEEDRRFRETDGWEPREFELRIGGGRGEKRVETEEGFRIKGRVDRVDFSESGEFLVVDYKRSVRKRKELADEIRDGRSLALPLYLFGVEKLFGGRPAGAYLLGARDRKRGGFFDSDLLSAERLKEMKKTAAVPFERAEMKETIVRALRFAGETVREIATGEFPVLPSDVKVCDRFRCPFRDLCRVVLSVLEEEDEV